MIVEKNTNHVAFQFAEGEKFFELGYKVLEKQKIANLISCIHVQYNMQDRLLYDVEKYVVLKEIILKLDEKEVLSILQAFFEMIIEVGSNGFVPLEAAQVGSDMIFWDVDEKKIYFIVLPIAKEYIINDGRNWNKRMWDTLNEILGQVEKRIEQVVIQYLSGSGKMTDNIEKLIPIIRNFSVTTTSKRDIAKQLHREMRLVHEGKYGQFAFFIRKKEFLIGKRKDSVDGYVGVSNAVSRVHCKIIWHDDLFWLVDLGSVNHTFVNGTLIKANEEKKIMDGDKVRIADVDFMVRITDMGGNDAI